MYYRIIDENFKNPYKVGDLWHFEIFGVLWMCQVISIDEVNHSLDVDPLYKIEERTFKLSEIKKAFWDTFHNAGEVWFNHIEPGDNEYFETPEESTNNHWEEFLYNLNHK